MASQVKGGDSICLRERTATHAACYSLLSQCRALAGKTTEEESGGQQYINTDINSHRYELNLPQNHPANLPDKRQHALTDLFSSSFFKPSISSLLFMATLFCSGSSLPLSLLCRILFYGCLLCRRHSRVPPVGLSSALSTVLRFQ
jgi:hypothetical protein